MTRPILLELSSESYEALCGHLFQPEGEIEQAAFGFVERRQSNDSIVFRMVEWMAVPPSGFEIQTGYHIELTDTVRASVIKRAHDLDACLVEFHSHTGRWPASFSLSDRMGFREFVPHVWWRLKGRPYVAVVAARFTLDGLVWLTGPETPERRNSLVVGGKTFPCTGLTPLKPNDDDE